MKTLKPLAALPTLITLGNAFCGLLAVTYVVDAMHGVATETPTMIYDSLQAAVLCLLVAMVFDFLDGKVARLTGSASEFGVQVDSLSDVISFGLVPALLFKTLAHYEFEMAPKRALVLSAFYLFGAVLRLARFNVETDESDDHSGFKGLPSPAAAAGIASLVFFYCGREYPEMDSIILSTFPWIVVGLGVLMWTKLPYIHFANVLLTEKRHYSHMLLILMAIGAIFFEPSAGIALVMLSYAASGPILFVWGKVTGRTTIEGESFL